MILSSKKHKISVTLAIIMVSSIVVILITFFIFNKNYDQQGTNIKNFSTISYIVSENPTNLYEQTFMTKNDNLDKIIFYYKNQERANKLEISLLDTNENKVIKNDEFIIQASDNVQIFNWNFENIQDSKNKNYSLLILPEKNNFELMTTPADRYTNGQLIINGVASKNDILAFSFDYHSDNLFSILQNRLGMYKPGIFNYVWVFDLLFIIILCLIGYLTYLITKSILDKN